MARSLSSAGDCAPAAHPLEFLEQILLALKRAGVLSSRRGMKGGYTLIKTPDHITLGQVIPSVLLGTLCNTMDGFGDIRTNVQRCLVQPLLSHSYSRPKQRRLSTYPR